MTNRKFYALITGILSVSLLALVLGILHPGTTQSVKGVLIDTVGGGSSSVEKRGGGGSIGSAVTGATDCGVLYTTAAGVLAQDRSDFCYNGADTLYITNLSASTTVIGGSILSGLAGNLAWDLISLDITGNTFLDDIYPENVFANAKVGIGTSSPFALLSITATQGEQYFAVGSTTGATGTLFLIDRFGRVGMATTAPGAQFSLAAQSRSTVPLFLMSTSTATATSTAFMIDSNGRIGVGTTSPGSTVGIVGNLNVTASTTIGSTLDVRKIFINDSSSGLTISRNDSNGTALTLNGGGTNTDLTVTGGGCLRLTLGNDYNAGPALQLCPNATGFGGIYLDAGASANNSIFMRDTTSGNQAFVVQQGTAGALLLQKPSFIQPLNGVASAAAVPLSIKSVSGQTANMLDVYSPSGAIAGYLVIGANGRTGIASSTPGARLSVSPSQGEVGFLLSTSTLTATSTAFVIDSQGRVAIGQSTTTPNRTLSVAGDTTISKDLYVNTNNAKGAVMIGALAAFPQYAGMWLAQPSPDSTNYVLLGEASNTFINGPTGGTLLMGVNNSQNVQINSNGQFRIKNDGYSNLYLINSNSDAEAYFLMSAAGAVDKLTLIGSASNASAVGFMVSNAEVGRFSSLSRFGVSSTTPGAFLSVDNDFLTTAPVALFATSSNKTALVIDSMGRVGIGTTSPNVQLEVNGRLNTRLFGLPTTTPGASAGNAVLSGGTITVNTAAATPNDIVMFTRKTSGGTIGTAITYTITTGSFTITSDSVLDTSTFSWFIIKGY